MTGVAPTVRDRRDRRFPVVLRQHTRVSGPPVSAGAFRVAPDGSADVNLRVEAPAGRFSRMGVSLEPDAGGPAPDGRPMLAGRLEEG